jgi:hypothetical protein
MAGWGDGGCGCRGSGGAMGGVGNGGGGGKAGPRTRESKFRAQYVSAWPYADATTAGLRRLSFPAKHSMPAGTPTPASQDAPNNTATWGSGRRDGGAEVGGCASPGHAAISLLPETLHSRAHSAQGISRYGGAGAHAEGALHTAGWGAQGCRQTVLPQTPHMHARLGT